MGPKEGTHESFPFPLGLATIQAMAQNTLVYKLTPEFQENLRKRMEGEPFEYRTVPHASFSAKGEGVVATLYQSGKLVVQGGAAEAFVGRYLPDLATSGGGVSSPGEGAPIKDLGQRPLIGSDEAGKGDYFGPLVTVACRAEPNERAELIQAGVADSKTLSDSKALRLGAALQGRYAFAIEVLDPPTYNQAHRETGNVNTILAGMHGRALRQLAEPKDMALVDRFANEKLVAQEVSDLDLELHQTPRAEREPVVAAASIVARAIFLEKLRELSEEFAIELRKGAGPPTDASGREFLALHGSEKLGQVAKLHFKNTQKIGG